MIQPGRYEIELRKFPVEAKLPMAVDRAVLRVGEDEYVKATSQADKMAAFTVELSAGITSLNTSLVTATESRERGAYYVYARKL